MSQASPLVLFLAGCSHHTRLNHSVQVAELAGSRIRGECKKGEEKHTGRRGDLSWDERDGIFTAQDMSPVKSEPNTL